MSKVKFNVRLEARLKNGDLVGAREQLGLTQTDVAKSIGISSTYYSRCENMISYPSQEIQAKICGFYRDNGVFLFEDDVFPEELRKIKSTKRVVEREIPKSKLVSLSTIIQEDLPCPKSGPQNILEMEELKRKMEKVLDTLTYREGEIIKLRYGIEDGNHYSSEEVGRKFKITGSRVREIEAKALRKLQHRGRSEKLQGFLDSEEEED